MFMTTMETSCQRSDRWESRLSTDKRPSAFSDWSSRRISESSSSTSSQPRRRCSAAGDTRVAVRSVRFATTASGRVEALTFLRCFLISSLNEHVPGALREEGQHQELERSGDGGQTQH